MTENGTPTPPESGKQYGIESLKKAVDFGGATLLAYQLAKQDGKIDVADIPLLMPPSISLVQLVGVVKTLPKEFAELDEAEKGALNEYIQASFDLPSDKAEILAKRSLKIAIELGDLIHDMSTGDAS